MNANQIIDKFKDDESNALSVEFSRGSVVGILKKACKSDGDYRLVLKVLTGKTSSKELTDAQWFALFCFVKPTKPENQKWQSAHGDEVLSSMCGSLIASSYRQEGQQEMFGGL